MNLETELLTAYREARQCLGVGVRSCAEPAADDVYCIACRARAEALHAVAAGAPPIEADPGAITQAVLPNGNIHIKHGRATIFIGSAQVLEDLRLFLAWPLIETTAERYDDALDTIEALRAA